MPSVGQTSAIWETFETQRVVNVPCETNIPVLFTPLALHPTKKKKKEKQKLPSTPNSNESPMENC